MPEENTPKTEDKPNETGKQGAAGTEGSTAQLVGELPEWARKEIKDLRAEAANYRTKHREAEEKVKTAKTPEEFEQAIAERDAQIKAHAEKVAEAELELARSGIAKKYSLPDEVAALLTGTAEEMDAKAKALSTHLAPSGPDPDSLRGGLNPGAGDDDDPTDPRVVAANYRKRRYGR